MKVYSGIFKRVWRSMKEEFKKRHKLNALYLPSKQAFGDKGAFVTQEDYRSDPDLVIPAADPNIVSDAMRMTQAVAMREAAHAVPGYDIANVEKNFLRALKVDAIDHFYPGPDKVPPLPNPKVQLEQMKLQGKQMDIEFKTWEFIQKLQSGRAKIQAEITNLYAQTAKLLAEAQTEKVRAKIEAFSAVVDALQTHHEMMTSQIEAMKGDGEGGNKDGSNQGAMGGMAGASSQPGISPVPQAGAAGANGAMGGGAVSAGVAG